MTRRGRAAPFILPAWRSPPLHTMSNLVNLRCTGSMTKHHSVVLLSPLSIPVLWRFTIYPLLAAFLLLCTGRRAREVCLSLASLCVSRRGCRGSLAREVENRDPRGARTAIPGCPWCPAKKVYELRVKSVKLRGSQNTHTLHTHRHHKLGAYIRTHAHAQTRTPHATRHTATRLNTHTAHHPNHAMLYRLNHTIHARKDGST